MLSADMEVRSASPESTEIIAREVVEVPGRAGVFVGLLLRADHVIMVDRPDILHEGVGDGPRVYPWPLGVPRADKGTVPGEAIEEGAGGDDPGYTHPVLWAAAVGRPNGRVDAATRAASSAAWKDLWERFASHLDPAASRLAAEYRLSAAAYRVLAARPQVADYVKVAPGLAPFLFSSALEEIPDTGWSLAKVTRHLVTRGEPEGRESPDPTPGTNAWMKRMTWAKNRHPEMPKQPKEWAEEARRLVKYAHRRGRDLDPNRLAAMSDDKEWTFLHVVLGHPASDDIVSGALNNPSAALKAIDRYFAGNPDAPSDPSARVQQVLQDIIEWRAAAPDVAARASGFKKMVEELVHWDRAKRAETLAIGDRAAAYRTARLAVINELAKSAASQHKLIEAIVKEAGPVRWGGLQKSEDAPFVPFREDGHAPEVTFGSYTMLELKTAADLQWETLTGEYGGMDNCVVTHAPRCRTGECRVFTVREGEAGSADVPVLDPALVALSAGGERVPPSLTRHYLSELAKRGTGVATVEVYSRDLTEIREVRGPKNSSLPAKAELWVNLALRVAAGIIDVAEAERRYKSLGERDPLDEIAGLGRARRRR